MAASGMLPFQPVVTADEHHQVRMTSSPKWWEFPLFGFSAHPDYINHVDHKAGTGRDVSTPFKTARFAPGSFTDEKARLLRRMTYDASSFHHSMYYSAIASRLASDFSGRTAP